MKELALLAVLPAMTCLVACAPTDAPPPDTGLVLHLGTKNGLGDFFRDRECRLRPPGSSEEGAVDVGGVSLSQLDCVNAAVEPTFGELWHGRYLVTTESGADFIMDPLRQEMFYVSRASQGDDGVSLVLNSISTFAAIRSLATNTIARDRFVSALRAREGDVCGPIGFFFGELMFQGLLSGWTGCTPSCSECESMAATGLAGVDILPVYIAFAQDAGLAEAFAAAGSENARGMLAATVLSEYWRIESHRAFARVERCECGRMGFCGGQTLFVNFDDVTLSEGAEPNAPANQTSLYPGFHPGFAAATQTFPFEEGAQERILSKIEEFFAPFQVTVTANRPAAGPYTMVVITSSTGPEGFPTGRANFDCQNASPNDIGFAFVEAILQGYRTEVDGFEENLSGDVLASTIAIVSRQAENSIASTAVHEAGHTLGLGHVHDGSSLMGSGPEGKGSTWGFSGQVSAGELRECKEPLTQLGIRYYQNDYYGLACSVGLKRGLPVPRRSAVVEPIAGNG